MPYRGETVSGGGGTITGDVELIDNSTLAAESLNEGDFATTTKWTAALGFSFAGAKAVYAHNAGGGTLTQTSANGAVPWASVGSSGWFKFTYTTSTVSGAPVATITSAFAASAQTLDISAGTHTIYFQAKSGTVGDFVISVTSVATETVSFDDLSLKRVIGGDLIANGDVTVRNRLFLNDGSLAAPSLAHLSDPTTGIHFDGTNNINFDAAGVTRFIVSSLYNYISNHMVPGGGDNFDLGGIISTAYQWRNAYLSRSIQGSKSKALTDAAAAVSFCRIAVPTNGFVGGKVIWTATSTDGTDQRTLTGEHYFSFADKSGTVSVGTPGAVGTAVLTSTNANTLTCTITAAVSGTNGDLQVTCTDNTAGSQTINFYWRLDMPIPATVTPL